METKSSVEVIDLRKGIYLFCFSTKDDYERALFGGPWYVLDHHLMLANWQPNFRPTHNPLNRLITWIHFSELPVEYYDKSALFNIVSNVGNPIRVDFATNQLSQARYAKVCTEINLDEPLTTTVWVGNEWQQVRYENIQTLCFLCGRVGHNKENCQHANNPTTLEVGGRHN